MLNNRNSLKGINHVERWNKQPLNILHYTEPVMATPSCDSTGFFLHRFNAPWGDGSVSDRRGVTCGFSVPQYHVLHIRDNRVYNSSGFMDVEEMGLLGNYRCELRDYPLWSLGDDDPIHRSPRIDHPRFSTLLFIYEKVPVIITWRGSTRVAAWAVVDMPFLSGIFDAGRGLNSPAVRSVTPKWE